MDLEALGLEARKHAQDILGYLNFSSGAPDPRFLRNLNALFGLIVTAAPPDSPEPAWQMLHRVLCAELEHLGARSEAFRNADQAEAALRLVFDVVLPGYRKFHRDLLFHQTDEALFQPFFLGRVCEAVLAQGSPWEESERILRGTLVRLNDFLGHRPVAVLRTAQKIQPYAHERVRPVPLYVRDAGVAVGRYQEVLAKALEILQATDPDLLDQAWFDPQMLDELAVDPRAYDFDHPVNRRPNYQFGTWDTHLIDRKGFYRRFVLQEVTLEGLWCRVEQRKDLPREETVFEAAAVLAGTILMGSGITGSGPETHDSSVTLTRLVPHIAAYRDAFYERLIKRMTGPHGERLQAEAKSLRQPFAGARQHLNQTLARRRAQQLQHVHLARLFARMGFTEAAVEQARIVPVASARMRSEIDCRLATAHLAMDRKELSRAAALVPEIEDLLHRAIECGAMVDPWNILGFGGQFSRFPSPEDSIHDERVDELIELMNEVFGLYTRLEGEAAAAGDEALRQRLSEGLDALVRWWDQFASTEVSGVDGVSGRQAWESAEQVATALQAWHQAGTDSANLAFWRRHAEQFRSPKTYGILVQALLAKHDLVAAMALLMHWLSQAETVPLIQGEYSFHILALRWMERLWGTSPAKEGPATEEPGKAQSAAIAAQPRWPLARKFLDYLEANAEDYWHVPRLDVAGLGIDHGRGEEPEEEPDEDADDPFSAAYENMTYRDTTDDGIEGEMLEWGSAPATDFELTHEAERISRRLAFLITSSRLWKSAATASSRAGIPGKDRDEVLAGWLNQALKRRRQLAELLIAVHRYRIPVPGGRHDAMIEFDRRQAIKESLLERVIAAAVETADAVRLVLATMDREEEIAELEDWERSAQRVLRAIFRGETEGVRAAWPRLLESLAREPLLYLPVYRGGNPQRIVHSRSLQHVLRRLLACLPRLGLLEETHQLLETVQAMERDHPAGPGAITEFDHLFEIACRGVVECLVASSSEWGSARGATRRGKRAPGKRADRNLTEVIEHAVELLLRRWLAHNRGVRISVLENLGEDRRWEQLRRFIERYGADLFTQRFMNYGSLRAILHQGVDAYLRALREDEDAEDRFRLLEDLGGPIPHEEAVRNLELTIEAIVENYAEYRDYNTTTTQSDRGELLYILLDFLRLKASYDRVAWNLRPVVIAHQVLLQAGRSEAAAEWRHQIAQRCAAVADEHLRRFEQLSAHYGMRLKSVADRLGERFVEPLAIDRLRAWVWPAMEELRSGRPTVSFDLLQRDLEAFTEEPEGAGLDVPAWLEALEEEVRQARSNLPDDEESTLTFPFLPQVRLSLAEIRRQFETWGEE